MDIDLFQSLIINIIDNARKAIDDNGLIHVAGTVRDDNFSNGFVSRLAAIMDMILPTTKIAINSRRNVFCSCARAAYTEVMS